VVKDEPGTGPPVPAREDLGSLEWGQPNWHMKPCRRQGRCRSGTEMQAEEGDRRGLEAGARAGVNSGGGAEGAGAVGWRRGSGNGTRSDSHAAMRHTGS
jgi:hypothetical protein